MSPTAPSLWAFRATVLIGLAPTIYFARAGERYLMWATLTFLILAIFALQSFGQVILKTGKDAPPDHLTKAMNGPKGIWIRAGLLLLAVLLVLLGVGVLEPAYLVEWLLAAKHAA